MTMTPIPALDRTSATFRADVDTFFASRIPTFVSEANALQLDVHAAADTAIAAAATASTAADIVDLAAAAANYKGAWSGLSGALAMPASVSHAGTYWALNSAVANVATETPGVSAAWQALNVGAGGSSVVSSAVDVSLSSGAMRVQSIAMTVAGKSVIMADATTLQTGSVLHAIKNSGTRGFVIRDHSGGMLAYASPGDVVSLCLVSSTTSAGEWAVSGSDPNAVYQNTALTLTSDGAGYMSVTALSDTTALVVWRSATGVLSACHLTDTGSGLSAGAVLTTAVTCHSVRVRVTKMSATQVLVAYATLTASYLAALTLNVSGTTVTNGAALTVNSLATDFVDVSGVSATQAIVVYKGTSSYGEARTLNISGTTVTAGAVCVVCNSAVTPGFVASISSTQAITGFAASNILTVYLLTISGTSVSAGASPVMVGTSTGPMSACSLSPSQVLLRATEYTGASASPPMYLIFEVSGATVVTREVAEGFGLEATWPSGITRVDANRFMTTQVCKAGYALSGKSSVSLIRVSDSHVKAQGQYTTISNSRAQSGENSDLAAFVGGRVLAVYIEPAGYLQARILEVAA